MQNPNYHDTWKNALKSGQNLYQRDACLIARQADWMRFLVAILESNYFSKISRCIQWRTQEKFRGGGGYGQPRRGSGEFPKISKK